MKKSDLHEYYLEERLTRDCKARSACGFYRQPSKKQEFGARRANVPPVERIVRVRIRVVNPPAGVAMCVQRGRDKLLPPTRRTDGAISFDFEVTVRPSKVDGSTDYFGEYVQGPRGSRFVYVNAGTMAGQPESCWSRRAKISLMGLEPADGKIHEATIQGTGRDGGPCCASVPLVDGAWKAL